MRRAIPGLLCLIFATTPAAVKAEEVPVTTAPTTCTEVIESGVLAQDPACEVTVEHEKLLVGKVAKAAVIAPLTWAVSMPIAIVRDTGTQWVRNNKRWTKAGMNPSVAVPASILYFPVAAVGGVGRGFMLSAVNAWSEKPFTKEAFSLGEGYE